jgi:PII-like signaling protein
MTPVKRIDIVVPEHLLREVLELIDRHGPSGYTVSRGLSGKGHRGVQSSDGIVAEFSNAAVLVACEETVAKPLLDELRPLLGRFGGMCLVSDAQWLKH